MASLPEPPAMTYAPGHSIQQHQIRQTALSHPHSTSSQGRSSPLNHHVSPSLQMPIAIPSSPNTVNHARSHDSVLSLPSESEASHPSSPTPLTFDAKGGDGHSKPASATGERKSCVQCSVSNKSRTVRDPEKQSSQANESYRHHGRTSAAGHSTHSYRPSQPPRDMLEEKSWRILLYLSIFSILVSFLTLIWTFLALLAILVLSPLGLFSKRPPVSQQLIDFLSPTLNIQLRFIYSSAHSTQYSAPILLVIHLLSPIMAIGVAILAWIAGIFSLFCLILGNPDGRDRDNDGKNAILAVRDWWEKWLVRALRAT